MRLMNMGRIKEEEIENISIASERIDAELDDSIKPLLQKHMRKKKRGRSN